MIQVQQWRCYTNLGPVLRILLLSDLHHELVRRYGESPASLPDVACDLVVLAGDIDVGVAGVRWAAAESDRLGKPILYVAGNHEHYGQDIGANLRALRRAALGTGVHFLENNRVDLGGARFLGCTLWTDYQAGTEDYSAAMTLIGARLPDHQLIRSAKRPFTPALARRRHRRSAHWLANELARPFSGPTVVISHHGPSGHCAHPLFSPGPLDGAFFSMRDDLVARADLWMFGPTHQSLDTRVADCRLVSNQCGYRGETSGFDPAKIVSLSVVGA